MKMPTHNSVTRPSSTHFLLLFVLFSIPFANAYQRTDAAAQEPLNLKGLKATPNPSVSSFQTDPNLRQLKIPLGSKTRHFKWEVEYVFGSPVWMEHCLKGIDGQFPGPTIGSKAGGTISVEVATKLRTEGVVIHWHGITQLGTAIPWVDGTASVTQYTINPGETFLYRFEVNKAGSSFFHVHFGMQRSARLYGSLIGAKPFIRQSRKLLNDEDKELGESKASVHGSGSKTSKDEHKEFGESKASVHGSVSKPAPSE